MRDDEPGHLLVGERLRQSGVSRRDFLDFCSRLMVAAPFMLPLTAKLTAQEVAREVGKARRLPVIWLHFQDCTGCSETLLRTTKPDLATLILDLISLDYHETLMAASGKQAEEALHGSMTRNKGRYVVVVEGSIPRGDGGAYMTLAGRPALEVLADVAAGAAAVIAIGSCASFGGLPAAGMNPTDATGVDSLVHDKPVINIPGCPPNPYTLLATVLQYARYGTLPALDGEKRPLFAYDRYIHDHCPRRGHFDAGRFVKQFGDDGHRQGWCLYEMGCKGPETHAGCSTRHFNEVVDVWPIGIGAPCVGCTERTLAFKVPMFDRIPIKRATPPDLYVPVRSQAGPVGAAAAGLVGVAVGATLGATYVASRRFSLSEGDESVPGPESERAPGADGTTPARADDDAPPSGGTSR
jgi:hydrogenase small subunit